MELIMAVSVIVKYREEQGYDMRGQNHMDFKLKATKI
jgi:hypothetical protein